MQLEIKVLIVLLTATFTVNVFSDSSVVVTEAWINEAPPVVSVHAGYMTVRNTSMENIKILNVDSTEFNRVEIHKTHIENGIAKMHLQESLTIPANSEFHLEPGGYHLMLFDSITLLKAGHQVPIELTLSNGEKLLTNAEVKPLDFQHLHNHH